ncbi:hypothetical protein [Roseovarius sp. MMSF_3281]|uniref:hypothetical protein n=1 Tax=Roseovarius sp. MMSF_3281 TaxID=3046694 RepID=UPI00273DF75C|nr:hypothetical protein [Roseovarius sp. MMSF_3281]
MAFDYTKSRATAERLIARFGQHATLRKITNSGPEWAPTQTEADTTITAVDLNEQVRDNSGTLVGQTRRTLYVSTSAGIAPAKGDKVFVGLDKDAVAALTEQEQSEAIHEIDEAWPLAPGGVDVFWEVDLVT